MAYVDWTYFQAYSPGSEITETEFNAIVERASDVIDMLTFYRIPDGGGISSFLPSDQVLIKKATAAQVETLYIYGGTAAVQGAATNPNSVSIGKFSYSGNGSSEFSGGSINGIPLSPLVSGYLGNAGLLYAGVNRGCIPCL